MGDKPIKTTFLPSDRIVSWIRSGKGQSKIYIWDAKGGFITQTLDAVLGFYAIAVSRDGKTSLRQASTA